LAIWGHLTIGKGSDCGSRNSYFATPGEHRSSYVMLVANEDTSSAVFTLIKQARTPRSLNNVCLRDGST